MGFVILFLLWFRMPCITFKLHDQVLLYPIAFHATPTLLPPTLFSSLCSCIDLKSANQEPINPRVPRPSDCKIQSHYVIASESTLLRSPSLALLFQSLLRLSQSLVLLLQSLLLLSQTLLLFIQSLLLLSQSLFLLLRSLLHCYSSPNHWFSPYNPWFCCYNHRFCCFHR